MPVNRAVRLLTRKLIRTAPNKVLAAPPLFSFDNLLLDLYNQTPKSKTVISSDLMVFLIEETLKKLSDRFSFFPKTSSPPNRLVQKVTKMISELRRFGYSANELGARDAEALEIEAEKFNDFVLILQELEKTMGTRYIDMPQAMHQAALMLDKDHFNRQWPGLENIFISGYGLFTPAMYTFIEKTCQWASVSVKLEFSPKNRALFEHTAPAYTRFKNMGAEIVLLEHDDRLAQNLFNRGQHKELFDAKESICHMVCNDRTDEVVRIAQEIHRLHGAGQFTLDKIAVTFSALENYVPDIRRVFKEFGIPFNLSTGYPLKQSPLIANLLNLLDLINENFEYGRVFSLLQSPFLAQTDLNFSLLYKAIINNRVRYLTAGWEARLLKSQKRRGEKMTDELAEQIAALKFFLKPFYDFNNQKRTVSNFKNDFLHLLEKCGALDWYENGNDFLNEQQREQEFRAYNRFIKIIEQFSWSMQILFKDEAIELKKWYQNLTSAVNNAVYNLTEWPVAAVQVMPRLEVQALDYDLLFMGGLVDGDFPRSSSADIFLSDANREKMGLVASEELLAQDRFMFYNLLVSAHKKVVLTSPRFSGDTALVPSTFLEDLKESCEVQVIEPREQAGLLPENEIISPSRLWELFGMAIQEQNLDQALAIMQAMDSEENQDAILLILSQIETQRQRLMLSSKPAAYEGNLSSNKTIQKTLFEHFKGHKWSISQLEDYAFCPMMYFLKRLLRLEETPVFNEELSPIERGNAVHATLFRFYSELRKLNALQNPQTHLELFYAIAREELARLPFDGFFWQIEQMRYFWKKGEPGLLLKFLEIEQEEISKTGYLPAHFEFCFGMNVGSSVDPASVKNLLQLKNDAGGLMLFNGKIDRIDIDPKTGQAIVFDYKTGSIKGKNAKPVAQGLSFQLPLYILAVEQFLGPDKTVVYGGYYQVKDAKNCKRDGGMADGEKYPFFKKNSNVALPSKFSEVNGEQLGFDALIEYSKELAFKKQRELFEGKFTHTKFPDDQICSTYCDYRRLCQKHVSKLKFQDRTEKLS